MADHKIPPGLAALRAELMAVAEADRLYWTQENPRRDEIVKYQRRQGRLREVRLEMMTMDPDTTQ